MASLEKSSASFWKLSFGNTFEEKKVGMETKRARAKIMSHVCGTWSWLKPFCYHYTKVLLRYYPGFNGLKTSIYYYVLDVAFLFHHVIQWVSELQLKIIEQNGFYNIFLISQPNPMMWPSLKSSLRHRVWLRNEKVSILKTLKFIPYLLPCWAVCCNSHLLIFNASSIRHIFGETMIY